VNDDDDDDDSHGDDQGLKLGEKKKEKKQNGLKAKVLWTPYPRESQLSDCLSSPQIKDDPKLTNSRSRMARWQADKASDAHIKEGYLRMTPRLRSGHDFLACRASRSWV
jgi:hypothetical protein